MNTKLSSPDRSATRSVPILGVVFDDVSVDEAIDQITGWVVSEPERLHQVATANPEFLVAARRDPHFRSILRSADLTTPDGVGILIASRILGKPVRHRVTGVDLVETLAARQNRCLRIFLLGAGPGIAAGAAADLARRFPSTSIAGVWEGSPQSEDLNSILDQLRQAQANILLVAFGAPKQDIWIDRYRTQLAECGIVVAIGIGGTLDYLAGAVPRAPEWIRRVGFEWLFRLIRQPWRWRRQLALPLFALFVVRQRLGLLQPDSVEHSW